MNNITQLFFLLMFLLCFAQVNGQASENEVVGYEKEVKELVEKGINKRQDSPEESLELVEEALVLARQKSDDELIFHVLIKKAKLLMFFNKRDEATELYEWMEEWVPKNRDLVHVYDYGAFYNDYGAFCNHSNVEKAIQLLTYAYQIRDSINSPAAAQTLSNMSTSYGILEEFDKALEFAEEALIIHRKAGSKMGIMATLNTQAQLLSATDRSEEAVTAYLEMQDMAKESNNLFLLSTVYNNLGRTYFFLKDYNTALAKYQAAKELYQSTGHYKELAITHMNIANVYAVFNDNYKAEENFFDALSLADSNETPRIRKDILKEIYSWYKKNRNFEKALEYKERFVALKDSLLSEKSLSEIRKLRTVYETDKAERTSTLLKKENELQKVNLQSANQQLWLWAGFALLISVISLFLLLFYRVLRQKNEQLKALNETKDKLFSIVAHDLRNPLSAFRSITNSLSEDLLEIDKEDLHYFIKQLNDSAANLLDLLHNLLYWSISQSGLLDYQAEVLNLNKNIEDSVNVLSNNIGQKKLNVDYEIDEKHLCHADAKMTTLLIRNLLANAIKFTPEKGAIHISSKKVGELIQISVKDNGIGIAEEEQQKLFKLGEHSNRKNDVKGTGTGLGLILCKELIERQGGKIWVDSSLGKGTTVHFTLPAFKKN